MLDQRAGLFLNHRIGAEHLQPRLGLGRGQTSVIVLAGTFTEVAQRFLNWNEQSKGVAVVKNICGVLVILGGVWLIYTAA